MDFLILFITIAVILAIVIIYTKKQNNEIIMIKDVLLSSDELKEHAEQISKSHTAFKKKKSTKVLLSRLDNNYKVITSIYLRLNKEGKNNKDLFPDCEWLLDNYYLIEEQVKQIRRNLSNKKYLKLMTLESGYLKGYPRVYAIALELVSHTDGRFNETQMIEFVNSYQSHQVLSIAEIWSLSLMVRVALIEYIRNICEKIQQTQDEWDKVESLDFKNNTYLIEDLKQNIQSMKKINSSYIEHLLSKARKKGIETGVIVEELNNKFIEFNTTVEKIIEEEHLDQAARKISIGNAITSLKIIATINWNDTFESLSVVDDILRTEKSEIYSKMDFESKDYYRHIIEDISKKCNTLETKIARKAVEYANKNLCKDVNNKSQNVGYYLIGKGRKKLLNDLGCKKANIRLHNNKASFYLVPIFVITALFVALLINYSFSLADNIWINIIIGIVVLIPASQISVGFVNWLYTHFMSPAFIPKLKYKDGIPEDKSTLIGISSLLTSDKQVLELLQKLEVYYLANKDENLYFSIVSDYKDADSEMLEGDREIVNIALKGIKNLNDKYSTGKEIFYLFHRHRQYCKTQNKWMGWEKKRGALIELNELLLGSDNTSFSIVSSDIANLQNSIRYVITLDEDTNLTLGSAKKLIGAISHPLNKAVFDEKTGVVIDGYGLIQPRISINIESSNITPFTRIFAGQGGIDTYSTAISDIYQDLFGEGIYTGKGIYDIKIFNAALKNTIKDNTILSHDLLEGSFVRTGLATDIELVDSYPSKYSSYMKRQHRWVRGDWQLIRWLYPSFVDKNNNKRKNPLSSISKWKIFDNLRRSLFTVNLIILFILSYTVFPGSTFVWIGFAFLSLCFPIIIELINYIINRYYRAARDRLNGNLIIGFKASLYQVLLMFVFLPHDAYMMCDAIFRTLYRVYISKKNLLEWVTAADVEKLLNDDIKSFIKRFKSSIITAIALLIAVIVFRPNNIIYAMPLAITWTIAPFVAYRISESDVDYGNELDINDTRLIRRIARKIWAFYEDFSGEENNYLPPDNYQEEPDNGLAHRTSPTNIGFLLLSTLAARDLGYISTTNMIERINNTISSIEKLETWNGHLYNWYDTKTLDTLMPYFISTVDSGNLISYMITVKQGLLDYIEEPLIDKSLLEGLKDTALMMDGRNSPDIRLIDVLISDNKINNEKVNELLEKFKSQNYDNNKWSKKFITLIELIQKEKNDYFVDSSMFKDFTDLIDEDARKSLLKQISIINTEVSLNELNKSYEKISEIINRCKNEQSDLDMIEELQDEINRVKNNTNNCINNITNLVVRIETLINETSFSALYDSRRFLTSIGYDVHNEKLTDSYYDLIASEARTTSYIAISRGEVPKEHWFKLGRSLSVVGGYKGLVSWTGSMFEYFMPSLVMKNYKNTILDETYRTVIKAQKRYGSKREVPWGFSESGYFAFDVNLNYQYKAFGVPDLGLKRGLIEETVVSPYSSFLVLPFEPKSALKNIKTLISHDLEGEYGLYEAVDYTPKRTLLGKKKGVVKSFMAHHQGMSFISIINFLKDNIMQKRFHSDPQMKVGEFLLQEKVPLRVIITKENKDTVKPLKEIKLKSPRVLRTFTSQDLKQLKCQMLSSADYSVMITNRGDGYSKNKDIYLTRWREDAITGNDGLFIYIKNINTDNVWSSTYEPMGRESDGYKVIFSQDKAEFIRTDDNIDTHTEIIVSAEDNAEIRTVSLTNHNENPVIIEVTSYMETVITSKDADIAHPAFTKLFVKTEVFNEYESLISSRRPRENTEETMLAFHTVNVEGNTVGGFQYETNRNNFIGRGRDVSNPKALNEPLSNTTGVVIDPIMSIRKRVKIKQGESVKVSFTTGVAKDRDEAINIIKKHREASAISRAFELAYTRSQVETRYLNLSEEEIETFEDMISHIVFLSPLRVKYADEIINNRKGQSGLWAYGISGDNPIVLVTIKKIDDIDVIKQMLKAHEYLRVKGLKFDLVILNEDESNYLQPLQNLINDVVLSSHSRHVYDNAGGVFVRNASNMPEEDKVLLFTVAKLVIKGELGSIKSQISFQINDENYPKLKEFNEAKTVYLSKDKPLNLKYFNGYGGFDNEGKEYVIRLTEDSHTPAPWINVISNDKFGFLVTESGSSYTWAENSRENKLTPWSNDPITDASGEILYIRDDENGEVWTPTALPVRKKESYTIRHGLGYSKFEHNSHGIEQNLTVFVAKQEPIKINLLKLKNQSGFRRRLTLTYYIRPVLGIAEEYTQNYIVTEIDDKTGALLIKNNYNHDFPNRIAFINTSEKARSYSGDRKEFIGESGKLSDPQALKREYLSNKVGAGIDPCSVIQTVIDINANEEKEIVFLFGECKNKEQFDILLSKYTNIDNCKQELNSVIRKWESMLGKLQVKTPDLSMDFLINYWLMYQTIACRVWARSAFYQSGGAYGFRDQLQDVMNSVYIFPEKTREQILIHCSHQFVEGDVQHWWHPGTGNKGIRTKFSDDLVWLPYVTAEYVEITGDLSILNEKVQFLESEPLKDDEDERYDIPRVSEESASVYEHCIRAIERSLKFGEHGIPLMGSGDWNDGMNKVGNQGKGESVWLGWFIYDTLIKYSKICTIMKDYEREERYKKIAGEIADAIEENAWDGNWYRRAYFDDGTPLGSSQNTECIIDSLAQSWSVISGAGKKIRVNQAMNSVKQYLIKEQEGLILLFTPPFDECELDPGYIKSYVPGVRENGGQYTHAATWVIGAFALMGKGDMAHKLYNLINPINHTRTPIECGTYKVEPYVMAADVYSVNPHTGRGGWTWYTGAAGWMYKVGLEYILGFKRRGNKLEINPSIPQNWNEYSINYKYKSSSYNITVRNPYKVNRNVKYINIDGIRIEEKSIEFKSDNKTHYVEVVLGE